MRKAVVLLSLAAAASPAAAQDKPREPSEPLAIQAMHNFGRCVAERTPNGARELLAMDYWTDEYSQMVRRMAQGHSYCASGSELQFSGVLFAGGLAERLLESGSNRNDLVKALAYDPAQTPVQARSETEAMAMCTVRQATGDVVALFGTTPATDDEKTAIGKVMPTVGQCLATGQTMRLNRPGLRSLLALAAYRLTQIGAPAPAGS